jgi:uncharacterized phage infection (PIP) family protein YhgE
MAAMKNIFYALSALLVFVPAAYALDKETTLQLQRYDQLVGRLQNQNEGLMQDIRTLQREMAGMKSMVEAAASKAERATDSLQTLENVKINNLAAGQSQIMNKLKDPEVKMDWGSSTRDCPELGNKHQQIKTVAKPDGSRTVRFLCFDGRALHLGTEVHSADAQ